MMDFEEHKDEFLDIVSKGLVIFMLVLCAFLIEWVAHRI